MPSKNNSHSRLTNCHLVCLHFRFVIPCILPVSCVVVFVTMRYLTSSPAEAGNFCFISGPWPSLNHFYERIHPFSPIPRPQLRTLPHGRYRYPGLSPSIGWYHHQRHLQSSQQFGDTVRVTLRVGREWKRLKTDRRYWLGHLCYCRMTEVSPLSDAY